MISQRSPRSRCLMTPVHYLTAGHRIAPELAICFSRLCTHVYVVSLGQDFITSPNYYASNEPDEEKKGISSPRETRIQVATMMRYHYATCSRKKRHTTDSCLVANERPAATRISLKLLSLLRRMRRLLCTSQRRRRLAWPGWSVTPRETPTFYTRDRRCGSLSRCVV